MERYKEPDSMFKNKGSKKRGKSPGLSPRDNHKPVSSPGGRSLSKLQYNPLCNYANEIVMKITHTNMEQFFNKYSEFPANKKIDLLRSIVDEMFLLENKPKNEMRLEKQLDDKGNLVREFYPIPILYTIGFFLKALAIKWDCMIEIEEIVNDKYIPNMEDRLSPIDLPLDEDDHDEFMNKMSERDRNYVEILSVLCMFEFISIRNIHLITATLCDLCKVGPIPGKYTRKPFSNLICFLTFCGNTITETKNSLYLHEDPFPVMGDEVLRQVSGFSTHEVLQKFLETKIVEVDTEDEKIERNDSNMYKFLLSKSYLIPLTSKTMGKILKEKLTSHGEIRALDMFMIDSWILEAKSDTEANTKKVLESEEDDLISCNYEHNGVIKSDFDKYKHQSENHWPYQRFIWCEMYPTFKKLLS